MSGQRKRRRRKSSQRNAIEWIVVVGGALLVAVLIKTFLFQAFYIPSASMQPTLKVGDRVLVNKLSYHLHDVHRGDIIVFQRPPDSQPTVSVQSCDGKTLTISRAAWSDKVDDLIKRVVALPGETVEWRNGHVFINGNQLDEPYLSAGVSTPQFSFGAQCIKVPDHDVFVLGDNRGNSSASNVAGPIDENLIVGRAFVRVWPPGSIGGL